MKAATPGHLYLLDHMDGEGNEILQFIEKKEVDGKLLTSIDGTTNEEVLKVLIDRLTFQYQRLPSVETVQARDALMNALDFLNLRTKDRRGRGVENTLET